MGQPPTWMPDQAPLPLGGGGDGALLNMVLQVHIDNPTLRGDIVDHGWGIRFWYLPAYSAIESGVLTMLTQFPRGGIPPGLSFFETSMECPGSCTRSFNENGVKFFGVMPHMHELGIGASIHVVRDNQEIATMHNLGAWDYNWQGLHQRVQELEVLPGDSIFAKCSYDSTSRTAPTPWGEGFMEEMCIPFLYFYPRGGLTYCCGRPDDIVTMCDVPPYLHTASLRDYTPLPEDPNNCHANRNRTAS